MDLLSMLKSALVQVPSAASRRSSSSSSEVHSQLRYISDVLFDEDDRNNEDEMIHQQNVKYVQLFSELEQLLNPIPPHLAPPCSGVPYLAPGSVTLTSGMVHRFLMSGARALAKNNVLEVYKIIESLKNTSVHGSWPSKLAYYYVDAFIGKLTGTGALTYRANGGDISLSTVCTMPTTVSNRFANRTILEKCKGATHVHIVDYGIDKGDQWPSLIKAFSERPEGPPHLSITGIDFPHATRKGTGEKLIQYASSVGVTLIYEAILTDAWELVRADLRRSQKALLIVNCNLRLRHLREDGTGVTNPRSALLQTIYRMRPSLMIQCEVGESFGGPIFLHRFQQSMTFFSAVLECYFPGIDAADEFLLDSVLKSSILNVVACEGLDRHERPASYKEWERKMLRAGFRQAPVYETACAEVVKLFKSGHPGILRREQEWLVVEWSGVVLYAMCAWE